ncbi:MAG: hypothetical protein ACRETH_12065, partial [Steroidobacteraceae bacterium]
RTLANQSYYGGDVRQFSPGEPAPYPYFHYYDLTLRYSRPWNGLTVGGEAAAGRDVFGQSFTRLSGFVRYGGAARGGEDDSGDEGSPDEAFPESGSPGSELFVDAGVNANQVKMDLSEPGVPIRTTRVGFGPHFAVGARRAVSQNNDLGVRLEFDEVDGHSLIGARALDFRHRYGDWFALSLFAGADRYDLATPAYSLYGGLGAQWRNFMPAVFPKWDLGIDVRYGQNIARDHVLPSDPRGPRPDSFYKISSAALYLSRHF